MAKIESHRDLQVWQRAKELAVRVIRATKRFPVDERFALSSQIRRSAVSVPSNIAEGFGRGSRDDYLRFLRVSRGSLFELDTQLLIAGELQYLADAESKVISEQWTSCSQLLAGLIRRLEQPSRQR